MNKMIEIAVMFLGGLSLLAVSFVGFSMVSGGDMHDIALIGNLLPETDEPVGDDGATEGPVARAPERSDAQVVEANLGVLGAWRLPTPYSRAELKTLTDDLKQRRERLELRDGDLDRREEAIQEELEIIAERHQTLEALRGELEAFQKDLDLRTQEVRREEDAVEESRTQRWAGIARVITGLETPAASTRLREFEPVEAARILVHLGDERAATLLNELDGAIWKNYVDAYTDRMAEHGQTPANR